MTIISTTPRTESGAQSSLRPLLDLTNGEHIGAWSAADALSIHDLAEAVRAWPAWRWVGLDAAAVTDVFPPVHPGRPVVFGLPTSATENEAVAVRRIGSWANVAVRGLGVDTATDAAALDRLRPEVGIIDGGRLGELTPRAVSGALSGMAAMLAGYDVLPVLDTTRAPHLLVDAAVEAGIRVAC